MKIVHATIHTNAWKICVARWALGPVDDTYIWFSSLLGPKPTSRELFTWLLKNWMKFYKRSVCDLNIPQWYLVGAFFLTQCDLSLIPGSSWLSRTSGAKRRPSEFHSWDWLGKKIYIYILLSFFISKHFHSDLWFHIHNMWILSSELFITSPPTPLGFFVRGLSFSFARRHLKSLWRKLLSYYHRSLVLFIFFQKQVASFCILESFPYEEVCLFTFRTQKDKA